MFTGIIGAIGSVENIEPVKNAAGHIDSAIITINAGDIIADLEHGGSLSVNGVCLTATRTENLEPGRFVADVMGETLARTNLGELAPGTAVNLERCMPVNGRFDGHVVQGHVDGVGIVSFIEDHENWRTLRFDVPREISLRLTEKGSIAINGTSLTVTAVSPAGADQGWFEVGLIPATLTATNLGEVQVGESVNLETDALAKYVQRLMEFSTSLPDTGEPRGISPIPASNRASELVEQSQTRFGLDSIEQAIEAIRSGRAVVVVDDENRENEGDIIFAAEHATEELMGFTIRYTSGVICTPLPAERADALDLPPMLTRNEDPKGTAYTVSCDAAEGITTGISSADRAQTARMLAEPSATAASLTRPGHIFPLRAVAGGVNQRPGHTEAAVELSLLAGLSGVGVIAELVHDNGSMMRFDSLRTFATEHSLPMISIEDLAAFVRESPRETA